MHDNSEGHSSERACGALLHHKSTLLQVLHDALLRQNMVSTSRRRWGYREKQSKGAAGPCLGPTTGARH